MENYKPNSHKYKEEQKNSNGERKKLDKIITGNAKVKKKFKFISEDTENVKDYIVSDVVIPAIKKLIFDTIRDGLEMFLYGGTSSAGKQRGFRSDYISYDKYSDRRDNRFALGASKTRSGYSYNDVTLDSRGEAEAVLDQLDSLIETYGMVSVADLYDLVGITGKYTDEKYGWTNLRNAEPVRVRDGYMLKLPKALPLD